MARKKQALHGVNFYNVWARCEHWYTFIRIVAKAELYAGLAQLIMDTLELDEHPGRASRVADIFEYAPSCRACSTRPRSCASSPRAA